MWNVRNIACILLTSMVFLERSQIHDLPDHMCIYLMSLFDSQITLCVLAS